MSKGRWTGMNSSLNADGRSPSSVVQKNERSAFRMGTTGVQKRITAFMTRTTTEYDQRYSGQRTSATTYVHLGLPSHHKLQPREQTFSRGFQVTVRVVLFGIFHRKTRTLSPPNRYFLPKRRQRVAGLFFAFQTPSQL